MFPAPSPSHFLYPTIIPLSKSISNKSLSLHPEPNYGSYSLPFGRWLPCTEVRIHSLNFNSVCFLSAISSTSILREQFKFLFQPIQPSRIHSNCPPSATLETPATLTSASSSLLKHTPTSRNHLSLLLSWNVPVLDTYMARSFRLRSEVNKPPQRGLLTEPHSVQHSAAFSTAHDCV